MLKETVTIFPTQHNKCEVLHRISPAELAESASGALLKAAILMLVFVRRRDWVSLCEWQT